MAAIVGILAISRYEATINHPDAAARYRDALQSGLGDDYASNELLLPIMASEDFSYYLHACPGAFALIGSGDGEAAHEVPCHSPNYDFNDALIDPVARIYARLAGVPIPD